MGFLVSFVKNDEIRRSISCQIILEWREERNQLNSWKEQLVICSSAFWKQKCENLKNISLTFLNFNPYRPTLSLARGTNRQFYCTGVIIYNIYIYGNYFFVSADRQTFLGVEMTANLRDTSPFRCDMSLDAYHARFLIDPKHLSARNERFFCVL